MMSLEEKINLVKDVKRFSVEDLGIASNSSFERVSDSEVLYFLYASRKNKIESVINKGSYEFKFFKKEEECDNAKKELEEQDYDTFKFVSELYGSEDCQISKQLLERSITKIAFNVLHENFHIHCRKNGIYLNYPIEEATANYLGYQGSIMYFSNKDKSIMPFVEKDLHEWIRFVNFVNKYKRRLSKAYEKNKIKHINKLFKKAIKRARIMGIRCELNNAFFIRYSHYTANHHYVFNALKEINPRVWLEKEELYEILNKV